MSGGPSQSKKPIPESFRASYALRVSNKNVREACDLMRFNCVLRIDCACGNSRLMGGVEALRQFGKTPIKNYAPRLRCSRCGQKRASVVIDTVPLR